MFIVCTLVIYSCYGVNEMKQNYLGRAKTFDLWPTIDQPYFPLLQVCLLRYLPCSAPTSNKCWACWTATWWYTWCTSCCVERPLRDLGPGQKHSLTGSVAVTCQGCQIGPKWDISKTFSDQISVHFDSAKKSRICPNLEQSDAKPKSDILVTRHFKDYFNEKFHLDIQLFCDVYFIYSLLWELDFLYREDMKLVTKICFKIFFQ